MSINRIRLFFYLTLSLFILAPASADRYFDDFDLGIAAQTHTHTVVPETHTKTQSVDRMGQMLEGVTGAYSRSIRQRMIALHYLSFLISLIKNEYVSLQQVGHIPQSPSIKEI